MGRCAYHSVLQSFHTSYSLSADLCSFHFLSLLTVDLRFDVQIYCDAHSPRPLFELQHLCLRLQLIRPLLQGVHLACGTCRRARRCAEYARNPCTVGFSGPLQRHMLECRLYATSVALQRVTLPPKSLPNLPAFAAPICVQSLIILHPVAVTSHWQI